MQMFSEQLANSQLGTIGGGFVGSLLFCFILTVYHVTLSPLIYFGLYRLWAMQKHWCLRKDFRLNYSLKVQYICL